MPIIILVNNTSGAAYTLACSFGGFSLTGEDAGLPYGYALGASRGIFTLNGQAAGLHVVTEGIHLGALTGRFLFTGHPGDLRKDDGDLGRLVIGSTVGGTGSFGYVTLELDAGETSEPFTVGVVPGQVLRSFGSGLVLVRARVGTSGPWIDLAGGLDLTAYAGIVEVQLKVTADISIEGFQSFPVFMGMEASGKAGWLLE